MDWCGDGAAIRWSGTSVGYYYPATWSAATRAAIDNAVFEFNKADFDYFRTSSSAPVQWLDLGSSDTSVAGATYLSVNCSTHRIAVASLYFNFPHFTASSHPAARRQCTAIHEMGHGVGFDHNTLTSILYIDHRQRCHSWTITTLRSHDVSDINTRY
ncbi:MAG: hypothetical protein M3295_02825 [Chloroflexota bacterium]|nr:hypothetical protein [Chloroflexota bacterium]